MKYTLIYISTAVIILIQSLIAYVPAYAIQDPELDLAVQRMHENNLTRYDNTQEYTPEAFLTREQGAKFFVSFNEVINNWIGEWWNCEFEDLEKTDPTLVFRVEQSCQTWLFKWAKWFFFPTEVMTKAQALTVLIRTLEWPQDETTIPRRKNYHQQARALSLTKELDVMALDKPVTRYEIALILYRASQLNKAEDNPDQNEAQISELINLLQQLGLQSS